MEKKTLQIIALAAGVALTATAGIAVLATGGDSNGKDGGSFLSRLHGHHLHGGGGHHHDAMHAVIEELSLKPDQVAHLDKIHEVMGGFHAKGPGAMVELHNELVAQFQQGGLDNNSMRLVVDDHVEQIREMGYAVTDELVALVNSLDATQRDTLHRHLQEAQAQHHPQGD